MVDMSELLVRARRAAGLSQEELARRAGTSRPTLSAYEHGRKHDEAAAAGLTDFQIEVAGMFFGLGRAKGSCSPEVRHWWLKP